MSEQDEGLRAVLRGHREDPTWPDSCICQDEVPSGGLAEGQYAAHLADAITAHLGATLAGLREDAVCAIVEADDEAYSKGRSPHGGETADAVLAVVRDALGVHPARSGGAVGDAGAEVAESPTDDESGRCAACQWVDLPRRLCEEAKDVEQIRGRPCQDHCPHPSRVRSHRERIPTCLWCGKRFPSITNHGGDEIRQAFERGQDEGWGQ